MKCTFCFASKGKLSHDAHEQADRTGNPVLFFEGVFRYLCLPDDQKLYDFTTKEDVGKMS